MIRRVLQPAAFLSLIYFFSVARRLHELEPKDPSVYGFIMGSSEVHCIDSTLEEGESSSRPCKRIEGRPCMYTPYSALSVSSPYVWHDVLPSWGPCAGLALFLQAQLPPRLQEFLFLSCCCFCFCFRLSSFASFGLLSPFSFSTVSTLSRQGGGGFVRSGCNSPPSAKTSRV